MEFNTKSLLLLSLTLSVHAFAETRQVGEIVWDTSAPSNISMQNVPDNMSQLVFIRLVDGMVPETNANLAVDSNYQISLSSGHVSNVLVCTGNHHISSQITANKSNDLTFNEITITTEGETTYFYQVQVNELGDTVLTPVNPSSQVYGKNLVDYLATVPKQNHQTSRIEVDCPPAPVYVPVEPEVDVEVVPEVELFVPYRLDVLFEFDKAVIQPVYNARIKKLADYLAKYPETVAIIEGHTDSIGTKTYNQKLSEKRANAVKNELINKHGVDSNRLSSAGYGESKPIASNRTKAGRQQNRRVVAIVSPK